MCSLCEKHVPAVSSIHVNATAPAQAIHGLLMLGQPYRSSMYQCSRHCCECNANFIIQPELGTGLAVFA